MVFLALAVFLLLVISEHEMQRLVLMVNDGNLFTGRYRQAQTFILKRFKSVKVLFLFLFNTPQGVTSAFGGWLSVHRRGSAPRDCRPSEHDGTGN